ncbi:MAG TPA: hypothetical protein VE862_00375 [Candidatus Acidoferrum sp.]|nr:hypothetical protein [Candidatus Acidoferrum sp.]
MANRFLQNSKDPKLYIVAVLILILVGAIVFEYYQNGRAQKLLAEPGHQQETTNMTMCRVPTMRIYDEPGYHLQNGTFVYSTDYDTIVVWTLIGCNVAMNNYSFVGVFKLLPVGFNGPLMAYYNPQAFTVYPDNATYEQRILLYLPSLGENETRDLTVQLIILAYTNESATIAGMKSVNITETG